MARKMSGQLAAVLTQPKLLPVTGTEHLTGTVPEQRSVLGHTVMSLAHEPSMQR